MNIQDQNLLDCIEIVPGLLAGKPVIRGYRISVEQILKSLGAGITQEQLLKEFPELEADDFRACLLYAGQMMEDEKIYKIA